MIVIIPDIFGWVLPNVRLLADGFARKTGLTVYAPDFMSGEFYFLMKQIPSEACSATLPPPCKLGNELPTDIILGDSFPQEHMLILAPDADAPALPMMAKA